MTEQTYDEQRLKFIHDELKSIRQMLSEVIFYIKDAESEIPEKMRRFIMYMHDVHDIKHLYEEHGQTPPEHVLREIERCDDRYRQLLTEMHTDGGAFEKIRAEMAKDKNNRWDHTRRIAAPKGGDVPLEEHERRMESLLKGNVDETRTG